MLFGNDRDALRRFYVTSWKKRQTDEPLEPLEHLVAAVIAQHPEYQPVIENENRALGGEYFPEEGRTNPFLHMGMHIAIQEQLKAGQPPGIIDAYRSLAQRTGDPHDAEHLMMECMAEALWQGQRDGKEPDVQAYLACVRKHAGDAS